MDRPTQAELDAAFRNALHAGWNAARRFLVGGLGNAATVDDLFFPMPDAAHVGDSQHRVDEAVNQAVEDALHDAFPRLRVIGEEIVRGVNLAAYSVAVLDPVDGTAPFRMLGCAWSVVMYIIVKGDAGLVIPIAGLVTSAGIIASVSAEHSVSVTLAGSDHDANDFAVSDVECSAHKPGAPLALACVGAKEKDFRHIELLRSAFRDAVIFNVGGNPVVIGLILGDLDAIVSMSPQTVWDSVYVLLAAHAGCVVGATDDERIYSPAEVTSWFRVPNQSKKNSVPAVIVAKSESIYLDILQGLRRKRD